MSSLDVDIYCDAAFSKALGLAVAGWMLLAVNSETNDEIQLRLVHETNNVRAELRGVLFALHAVKDRLRQINDDGAAGKSAVRLYTDSQAVCGLKDRRDRLERRNFISNATGLPLTNADLYRQFYALCDSMDFQLQWIKGHTPSAGRDTARKNFSRVDKAVRKELRRIRGI